MKAILIKIISLLPQPLKDELYLHLNKWRSRKIIKDWKALGKPDPPPHVIKQQIISRYRKMTGYDILIETGTLFGDMIEAQRRRFKKVYSIELSTTLWQQAREKFKRYPNVFLIHGDSAEKLSELTASLNEPAIFWLDGHYSAGNTAMGDVLCPVLKELEAILWNKNLNHVILIDDARNFTGENTYPTIEELKRYMVESSRLFEFSISHDIIQISLQSPLN